MNAIIALTLGLLMTFLVVATFYQKVVRPVLLRTLLHRLFAKRDALRRMVINGELSSSSSHFHYLQDFLCKSLAVIPNLNLWRFVSFSVSNQSCPNLEVQVFAKTAPRELIKLRGEAVEDLIAILMLNSPFTTAVALVVVPFLWIIGKLRTIKVFQATEELVLNVQAA